MKTILVLSAGRRVELVQCFKQAAKRLKIDACVIAADLSPLAPALYFADQFRLLPSILSKEYIDAVLQICIESNVDLVVPTIDTELLVLAENRAYIETHSSTKVMVSSQTVIHICRDKLKTTAFFGLHKFLSPEVITEAQLDTGDYCFPLFIKPQDGSSSINAFPVYHQAELDFFRHYIPSPMVQKMIRGEEYTVDVFCDFYSNIISVTPRLRIAIRSGEILKGKICKDKEIIEDVTRLMEILHPIGHITVQCMKTERGIEYIEINPRFGGGAPMSIKAGADSCEYIFRLLEGEILTAQDGAKDGLLFSRFDDCVCLDENMVPVHD